MGLECEAGGIFHPSKDIKKPDENVGFFSFTQEKSQLFYL